MINMSIEWNDLLLFLQVVERKGFTSAGEALGIPKSRLSRRVTLLEARLGTRLLQRSSRRLSLTDAGQALYAHCQVMLKEAEAGIAAVQQRSTRPMGKVRLSLPVGLSEMIAGTLLPRFLQCFPDVQVAVQATNRSVDLIAEQVDVVVRGVGTALRLDTSSLVQACVCTVPWRLVCSPAYREKIGPLNSLGDLEQADLLLYTPNDEGDTDLRLIDEQGVVHTLPMPIRCARRRAAISACAVCPATCAPTTWPTASWSACCRAGAPWQAIWWCCSRAGAAWPPRHGHWSIS